MSNSSIRKAVLSTLLLLLAAVSYCMNSEVEELIYLAVNTKDAARAELLIKAVEKCPDDSIAALNLLANTDLRGKALISTVKKYDSLWKKHPHNPDIVYCGIQLFNKAGLRTAACLENLKKSSRYFYSSGKTDRKIHDIQHARLIMHMVFGDTVDGAKFASTLSPKEFPRLLTVFYSIAWFRADIAGDVKESKACKEKYQQMTEYAIANISPNISFSDLTGEMVTSIENGYCEYADALFKFGISQNKDIRKIDQLRAIYAVNIPDFAKAEQQIAKIKDEKISKDKENYLFAAALNAQKWDVAEKLIEKIAPPQRKQKRLALALAKYDGKALAAAGDDKTCNLHQRALYKFCAASILKDKKFYYEAKELLKNRRLSIDELNTMAYTAAELGIELDESYAILLRVVNTVPENAAYLDSLAYVCYRKGLFAQADKYIRLALARVRRKHGPAVILEHAADIALAQGDFYRAKTFYQRALEFGRNDASFNAGLVKNKLEKLK